MARRGRAVAILIGRFRNLNVPGERLRELAHEAVATGFVYVVPKVRKGEWPCESLVHLENLVVLYGYRRTIDEYRKEQRDGRLDEDIPSIPNLDREIELRDLHPAIDLLPEEDRKITRRWMDGLTYEELAKEFGSSTTTMFKRFARIRERLRGYLDGRAAPGTDPKPTPTPTRKGAKS